MLWADYQNVLNEQLGLVQEFTDIKATESVTIKSALYSSAFVLRSRETVIQDDKGTIYNNIVYPKTGSNLPAFGMDLMAFSPKKTIVVFDFQHPTDNYDYNDPIVEEMMGQYLENTKDGIRFFEPGNHFSRYIFVRKCTAEQVNGYLDDFRVYVDTYKTLLDTYRPTGKDYCVYKDFDDYMRKLDPVEGYLAHKFDKEFARKYVDEFLFPIQQ